MWSWKKKIKKKDKIEIESLTPDRYIDLAKTNRNKQKIIYALTLIIIFLVTILGMISFSANEKVYIVEKNGDNYTFFGKVNDLTKTVYNPDDKSLIYFINNFIIKARFLPTDLVLYKENQKDLGYFLTKKSIRKLDQYLEDSNYAKMIEDEYAVDIEILSTLRFSEKSFQVRWIEKTYDKSGKLRGANTLVGVLQYELKEPGNKEAVLKNPLGIVITDLSMSLEK
ncbi:MULTISPECIES: type IV secretion system protein [Fusobacterium]|jgi:hypothetical protein|uniref:Bacterial virulence protein VirB8 domain-containing protein n=2 Tax=Fusobacterium TaxID=848 RepID=A0A241Q0N5_FUSNP|nr:MULTISPECIES: type IV secretion system protein [Fusobacterium]ALQ38007.1 hypothetical protein RN97_07225 [Fusobacterium hwasookii ChDC F300]ASG28383.1 hypothetical protein CBG61_05200 [Fusobacterium polymorphum]ETZ29572.1 hypothetical protein HMPREF2085_00390 [Fusobacterium nucleatum 13_3C]